MLYLGADEHCAFIETFGQATGDRFVTLEALEARGLVRATSQDALRLVDLTGSGLVHIGADERLCSGEHALAQQWSKALHDHPAQPDGIYYRARHDPSRMAAAVFERVMPRLKVRSVEGLLAPAHQRLLAALLDHYKFGL